MEHIVQFAIGIDDEAIRKRVIESAYNDVVKQLMDEAKKEVGLAGRVFDHKVNWNNLIDQALRNYLEENKEIVIDRAANKLAESYKCSKTFKEKMADAIK